MSIDQAREILESVEGKVLSMQERKALAIELAGLLLAESSRNISFSEKRIQAQLSRLMSDIKGKAFTTAMTDQCFRSAIYRRAADQLIYLLNHLGVPHYLPWMKRLQLFVFKSLPVSIAKYLVPLATHMLRRETSKVILPGETSKLNKHLIKRKEQGVQLNLNHLGEAILSEKEALGKIQLYIDDLKNEEIDYISIKISTIFSQINLIAFDDTVSIIQERLKTLYRAAIEYGKDKPKFVNLDMEEYRDLHLTVVAFMSTLDEPEFFEYPAGIVLQAYLPDSHEIQKKLTEWAKKRVASGGAPIKIRIVKGANLAMEQFEASLRGWPQAPYTSKVEVDANYKQMVLYGCQKENARAVRLGVASHNLFDIALTLLVRKEHGVESYVGFEMLEGMADHVRRAVQSLSKDMLLYCPVATREEFQHAIAYLIRRLDENTGPENFLRYLFELKPGTAIWDDQVSLFSESCDRIETVSTNPRRTQNRGDIPSLKETFSPFENESDTDFSLPANQSWAKTIIENWKEKAIDPIPLVIGGQTLFPNKEGEGLSPSDPGKILYHYAKASKEELLKALETAKSYEKSWQKTDVEHRSHLLFEAAQKLRERRSDLLGAMMMDAGKTFWEADPEISEAIDFAEYYRRQMEKLSSIPDIQWSPKGTILVASPWNFPCAIPIGGVVSALVTGNCVLFKPASETLLVAWHLVQALWDAGIPKEALQFIPSSGKLVGEVLIPDPRINCVILTGGTQTAENLLKIRPDLDLAAETGGKNSLIVSNLSDRDLAVRDLVQSAFGHGGQKCSACSLGILEKGVYNDPHFRKHLKEAAASLTLGPAWDLPTRLSPLIHPPEGDLKRGLTTLEPGEEWLLEPKQDPNNPCLWSPGIKLGVKPGSFTHKTELFGPVLGLMRAENLSHAIDLANQVPFGLTSGLQSLDEREHTFWMDRIIAGNLYINTKITGAIVCRQPFGGTKASNFGAGSKAGGPNYLFELLHAKQAALPKHKHPVNEWVNNLTTFLENLDLSAEELGLWIASITNYAYWAKRLSQDRDPTKIVGQDNLFRYVPRKNMVLRIGKDSPPLDILRACAASLSCGADMHLSCAPNHSNLTWLELLPSFVLIQETEETLLERISNQEVTRIRMVEPAPLSLRGPAALQAVHIADHSPLANGRLELLHYLREVAISIDYHRYGNLGLREGELRKPIL